MQPGYRSFKNEGNLTEHESEQGGRLQDGCQTTGIGVNPLV